MQLNITKDWFLNQAHLEEGLEIGAGALQHIGRPALRVVPAAESSISTISQHLTFGRFVEVMRRKQGWTVSDLAIVAEVSPEELLVIEGDPYHEPELSTVFGLAKTFNLPAKNLVRMAGLTQGGSSRLREESVRFAACSESKEPLTEEENTALQAFLKVIVEESDQ